MTVLLDGWTSYVLVGGERGVNHTHTVTREDIIVKVKTPVVGVSSYNETCNKRTAPDKMHR